LIPPKGRRGPEFTKSFTKHDPVSRSFEAINLPLSISRVSTAAPRPKEEQFASSIAYCSDFADIIRGNCPKRSVS